MLKDVLKDYADLPGKEVTIRFTPEGRSLVRANPLLKDVFSNLVDNAVKHSGGPLLLVVNVSKISLNGSAFYRVAIEDNGNGIPDDKKDEVFHRFKRGQTKARARGSACTSSRPWSRASAATWRSRTGCWKTTRKAPGSWSTCRRWRRGRCRKRVISQASPSWMTRRG